MRVELCSRCQTECSCFCCAVTRDDTTPVVRLVHVDRAVHTGQVVPPAPTLSPALTRRQTISAPVTTVLPACRICKPLPYNHYNTAGRLSELDAQSSVDAAGDEPRSLAVEVDSDHFVDVAVGTDRLPETVSSHCSDWLSSRHHEVQPIITEPDPQWSEMNKFAFYLSDKSQQTE